MKQLFLTLLLVCAAALPALASDLTATSTPSIAGGFTGSVDLTVGGGVAPYTYSWTGPAGFTATTEDLTGVEAGTYVVTVNDYYCGIAILTVVVDEDSLASAVDPGLLLTAFSAYPNPFQSEIHVKFTSPVTGSALLQLTDAKGQVVTSTQIELTASVNENTLTLARPLAAGVYFLRVIHNETIIAKARLIHS